MTESGLQSGREKGPQIQRLYEPDCRAMLSALRVVLGLPKQLPEITPDDLLSDAN